MDRCGFQRSLWAMLGGLTGCVADVDEQTFVIDDPVEVLSVDSDDADVDVVGTDEDHVRIEATRWWTLYRPRVRVRVRDEVVDVSYECSGGQAVCLVEFAIRVPDEVDVTVSADDGETLLSDLRGNLSVTSDWGSIRGYRLESPHTQVDTVNGDVRLLYRTAPMDVFVDARGGDVELELPADSYAFDLFSELGEVVISSELEEEDPDAPRTVEVSTVSGDISVSSTQ